MLDGRTRRLAAGVSSVTSVTAFVNTHAQVTSHVHPRTNLGLTIASETGTNVGKVNTRNHTYYVMCMHMGMRGAQFCRFANPPWRRGEQLGLGNVADGVEGEG